jgi:TolB-like protein
LKSKPILIIPILIIAFLVFSDTALADKPAKVLVLPFNIHSEKDMSYLKEGIMDMLATRLTLEGQSIPFSKEKTLEAIKNIGEPSNEQAAVLLGMKLGADYVLYGSLTVFGDSISTDARFFDINAKKPLVTYYDSGKDNSDVITHIDLFAGQIKAAVFGRKAEQSPFQPPQKETADESRRHPEAVWAEEGGQVPDSKDLETHSDGPGIIPGTPAPSVPEISGDIWKSQNFDIQIIGIGLGDITGNGRTETVFIGEQTVFIYQYADGKFEKIGEVGSSPFHRFISADVADINQNGRAEIFVTNIHNSSGSLQSFVLEWDGSKLKTIVEGSGWYYRLLNIPEQGKVLLGQQRNPKNVFLPGVYELKWDGREYIPGKEQILPRDVNIYDFTYGDVLNSGQEKIVAFSANEYIRIMDRNGEEEWRSPEPFGGSSVYLEFPDEAGARIGNEKEMSYIFLSQRIHLADADNDGKNEIIVGQNMDKARRLLSRLRLFKSGHIECLVWDNFGLYEKWRTREISGHISDYVIGDIDSDRENELVFSVVTKISSILGKAKSFIAFQKIGKIAK